jgi:hypothetical protein
LEFCETLQNSELVSKDEPNEDELFWCWPESFKTYVEETLGEKYPISIEQRYKLYIKSWMADTEEGKVVAANRMIY